MSMCRKCPIKCEDSSTHQDKSYVVALAGNPNAGKSTVFNKLTGLKQHTGNWAGKTVTSARGSYHFNGNRFLVFDLPGTYSLLAHSPDEEVTRDFLAHSKPAVTVIVLDATILERNLNLALQIMNLTQRVVICVNLIDEAERKGIKVDSESLSNALGVPVVTTNASKGVGLERLVYAIDEVARLENEESTSKQDEPNCHVDNDQATAWYYKRAQELAGQCLAISPTKNSERDLSIDRILTSKFFGFPIMGVGLALVLWLTIAGANYPSSLLLSMFFTIHDWLLAFMQDIIGAPDFLTGFLVDGVYKGLAWVVAVMLPPMAIFFPIFTFLEDIGYLPRIAFNLDRAFRACGAHGKQALTMAMGFGCNAAGVIACRIIESPRERLIAILTNNFSICNGRWPTIIMLSTIFVAASFPSLPSGIVATFSVAAVMALGMLAAFAVSKVLSTTILRGEPSHFVLELPPYRRPNIMEIIYRSLIDRTLIVLGRACRTAAPCGGLIWLLANVSVHDQSLLKWLCDAMNPIGVAIGLDGVILVAYIIALPANEIIVPTIIMTYTAAGQMTEMENLVELSNLLRANGWDLNTAVTMMLFSLLHNPCATTSWTIFRETGSVKWMVVANLLTLGLAITVCFLFNQIA